MLFMLPVRLIASLLCTHEEAFLYPQSGRPGSNERHAYTHLYNVVPTSYLALGTVLNTALLRSNV